MNDVIDDNQVSVYFGPDSPAWMQRFEYNLMFLHSQERYFNQQLAAKGSVFLNEIYDELGIKRTTEGQKKGWLDLLRRPGDFDPMTIDFGLSTNLTDIVDRDGRILLRFNTQGEIIEDI